MPQLQSAQLRYLRLLLVSWLGVFFVTRTVFLLTHWQAAGLDLLGVLRVYGVGLIYDAGFLLYAALPLALALWLVPAKLWRRTLFQRGLYLLTSVSWFVMLFVALSEWFFWDEFGVRFNFIAVDYLVYSEEVINNILESYPVYPLLALLACVAVAMTVLSRPQLARILAAPTQKKWAGLGVLGMLSAVALLLVFVLGQSLQAVVGSNVYQRELASNGPFQFFAAFRNNELDYQQFYSTVAPQQAASALRAEVAEANARFIGEDPLDIRRVIDNPGTLQKHNVVLVTIESLSAKYLGSFGDPRGLTPNLDALRAESLTFTNFYATGTRTDRGLEAITLAIPPTPGRSIVKRLGRESGYASLGQQFKAQGYDSVFVYGGRGYFDNMNAFFGGNGYRVVDQSSVAEADMQFQNAWGMSDEDLYGQTLKLADHDYAAGKPFFLQLMTTSNHRPYTYPAGRIDIASGDGREGSVKYTDYAIGQFLQQAKSKPWFNNTIFIFVADHTAGSAGKEDLPVANYHIPLFIYAPELIAAREVNTLTSQIDLAPTLLGLLNMDYVSTFYGRNVLADEARAGRALIGNYQHLGLFDGQDLAILSPRRGMRRHDDALGVSLEHKVSEDDPLLLRDIAYYQGASYAFGKKLMAWKATEPLNPLVVSE